jgi:hypothetical protein
VSKALSARILTSRKRSETNTGSPGGERARPRTKGIGLCSEDDEHNCRRNSAGILKPVNEGVERSVSKALTFDSFVELTHLPVYKGKWKKFDSGDRRESYSPTSSERSATRPQHGRPCAVSVAVNLWACMSERVVE